MLAIIVILSVLIVTGLLLGLRHARQLRSRCDRAVGDYRSLVDHRIANPLSAISCAASTLLDDAATLDASQVRFLLALILEQSLRIEQTSLSPRVVLGLEELCLSPIVDRRVSDALAIA